MCVQLLRDVQSRRRSLIGILAATLMRDQPRSKGSPNISRGKIDRIAELHQAGLRPEEIAAKAGVSRATAYRRVAQLKKLDQITAGGISNERRHSSWFFDHGG